MVSHLTEQEAFWAGEFGDSYAARNDNPQLLAHKTGFFARALARAQSIESAIELGANVGLNLMALRALFPAADLAAVELNENAYKKLCRLKDIQAYNESVFGFTAERRYTLSVSCGLMIHINPDFLPQAYDALHGCSAGYILVAEYYNPTPVTVTYRGHDDRLFKRDFAGEMLDRFSDLALIDYGFVYHRDPNFPLDDLNWFLLKKADG